MGENGNRQDQIDTTAAEWAARLGGAGLSGSERRDLDRWLAESPAHATAFDEARAAWDKMGKLRFAPGALAEDIVPPPAASRRPSSLGDKPHRSGLRARIAAIAACLIVLAWGTTLWTGDPLVMLTADHQTAPGEQRLITLSDGSTVDLGPASAITLDYTERARRIRLLSGVAYFTAAPTKHDESRPFIVDTANGSAQALGTQFMVERLDEDVQVTVAEHRVEVALGTARQDRSTRVLARGQAIRYSDEELGAIQNTNLKRATAWRRGRLIFDDVPLGEVVAALNRYRRGQIIIADPTLSARKVSGIFETAAPNVAIATITQGLQIKTASLPPLVTLLY